MWSVRTKNIIFSKNPSKLADVASPGGLNIFFSALNVVQRVSHCFLELNCGIKMMFLVKKKKVCGGPERQPTSPRNSQADITQRIFNNVCSAGPSDVPAWRGGGVQVSTWW